MNVLRDSCSGASDHEVFELWGNHSRLLHKACHSSTDDREIQGCLTLLLAQALFACTPIFLIVPSSPIWIVEIGSVAGGDRDEIFTIEVPAVTGQQAPTLLRQSQ